MNAHIFLKYLLFVTCGLLLPEIFSQSAEFFSGYFSFLVIISLIALIYSLIQFKSDVHPAPKALATQLSPADLLAIFIIFIFGLKLSLAYINASSIWLDESEEGYLINRATNLVVDTAHFQQPALAYFWRKLGLTLVGKTETGLRIASTVGYALFNMVMFINFKAVSKNRFEAFLATLFLSLNVWLMTYSVEARPYAISLFYFSIFIYFFLGSLTNADKKFNFAVFASALLWLLSISMQPLAILTLLLGFLIAAFIIKKEKIHLVNFYSILAALLLFTPLLYKIVIESKKYVHANSIESSSFVLRLYENILNSKELLYRSPLESVIAAIMLFAIFLCLLLIKHLRKTIVISTLFIAAYFVAILLVFTFKINWHIEARYSLCALPLFYLLFLKSVTEFEAKMLKFLSRATLAILVLLCSLAAVNLYALGVYKPVYTDWRALYKLLDANTKFKSTAFILHIQNPQQWSDDYFAGKEFYSTPKVDTYSTQDLSPPLIMSNDKLVEYVTQSSPLNEIFIILREEHVSGAAQKAIKAEGIPSILAYGFWVLKQHPKKDRYESVYDIFEKLAQFTQPNLNKFKIYDGLFLLSLTKNDCRNALTHLTQAEEAAAPFGEEYLTRLLIHKHRFDEVCRPK